MSEVLRHHLLNQKLDILLSRVGSLLDIEEAKARLSRQKTKNDKALEELKELFNNQVENEKLKTRLMQAEYDLMEATLQTIAIIPCPVAQASGGDRCGICNSCIAHECLEKINA